MDGEDRLFLADSGLSGALQVEHSREGGPAPRVVELARPAVLVGSSPDADVVISEPGVGVRHAYFQVVEGRVFAVDLESRLGLKWNGVPRLSGWVADDRPVQVGSSTLRALGAARGGDVAGPGPTSSRYRSRADLPGLVLEVRGPDGSPRRFALNRVLTLIGRSDRCQLRIPDRDVSRFVCSLVRTPNGVWLVDLLSTRGVALNGVRRRRVRLDDGDAVRFGAWSFRVFYGDADPGVPAVRAAGTTPAVVASRATPRPAKILPRPLDRHDEAAPEALLERFLDRGGPTSSSSPFGDALVMLVQLLGEMHQEHVKLVRDELDEIRRLHREMSATRERLARMERDLRPATPSGLDAGREAIASGPPHDERDGHEREPLVNPRLDPDAVQAVIGERLEAWERERRSGWRKLVSLLVKP